MGAQATELPGLGGSLLLSFASLGVVCLVAYVFLRWLSGRGVGRAAGPLRVLARCPLEPRRSVYLIETAGRCFLVGVGEGPMSLLAEVDRDKVEIDSAKSPGPFAAGKFGEVLAKVMKRNAPSSPSPEKAP